MEPKESRISSVLSALLVPSLLWSVLNALVSAVSVFVYGAYTLWRGPFYLMNQFVGMWLCIMLVFFSLQNVYHCIKPNDRLKFPSLIANLIYYGLMAICSFILFLGYAIGGIRSDAIIWTILIFISIVLNIALLLVRFYIGENFILGRYSRYVDLDQKPSEKKVIFIFYTIGIVINTILKCLVFLFMALLTSGSITLGRGAVMFPPRGNFVTVTLNDGSQRTQTLHYMCQGTKNSSLPTFMIEGDFSHGIADYYDLQNSITKIGRRSCIWDKPGLGYSSYLYADQYNVSTFYHEFLTSIESGPYIMVGWGGGGGIVYNYALQHPELVKSLVFLDVYPDLVEFNVKRDLLNWTNQQYQQDMNLELAGRRNLINIINGLGVPWGIMPLFVPITSNSTYRYEQNWFFITEKTWGTQKYFLDLIGTGFSTDSYSTKLNSSITINMVNTQHTKSYVIKNSCKNIAETSDECQYQIKANQYYIDSQLDMVDRNGGLVIGCTADECSQSYYVYQNTDYTASILRQLYGSG